MPKGKPITALKAVSVKDIQEVKTHTDDGTTIRYRLRLESEAQGVRAAITRDDPWTGVKPGTKVDLIIETTQTTLDTGEE